LGGHLFLENRNKNCHLLLQYEDMVVAWFPDGSGIRDADNDEILMRLRMLDVGEDPSWYNYEYVEPQAVLIDPPFLPIPSDPAEAKEDNHE
jgi:hypothetical protein